MKTEIKISQAVTMLGVSRAAIRKLIKQKRLEAIGNGPARRIILESIEKSGLPIQETLWRLEPEKQWYILMMSGDCRARDGEGMCGHREARHDYPTACSREFCPLAVRKPCKSNQSE
jgi:hypothetical protein